MGLSVSLFTIDSQKYQEIISKIDYPDDRFYYPDRSDCDSEFCFDRNYTIKSLISTLLPTDSQCQKTPVPIKTVLGLLVDNRESILEFDEDQQETLDLLIDVLKSEYFVDKTLLFYWS